MDEQKQATHVELERVDAADEAKVRQGLQETHTFFKGLVTRYDLNINEIGSVILTLAMHTLTSLREVTPASEHYKLEQYGVQLWQAAVGGSAAYDSMVKH